jgi:hypothetical protein
MGTMYFLLSYAGSVGNSLSEELGTGGPNGALPRFRTDPIERVELRIRPTPDLPTIAARLQLLPSSEAVDSTAGLSEIMRAPHLYRAGDVREGRRCPWGA